MRLILKNELKKAFKRKYIIGFILIALKTPVESRAFTKNSHVFPHLMNSTQTFNGIFKKYCGCENDSASDSEDINIDVNSTSGYRFKIPRKVWEYQLGGHQIVKKTLYLKRGEWTKLSRISQNEVLEFLKIIRAVELTIEIQDKILPCPG
jgi:hypothetical protein